MNVVLLSLNAFLQKGAFFMTSFLVFLFYRKTKATDKVA